MLLFRILYIVYLDAMLCFFSVAAALFMFVFLSAFQPIIFIKPELSCE